MVDEWISVTDRLPGVYEAVIVLRADGEVVRGYLATSGKWNYPTGGYGPKATHWIPFPKLRRR